MLSTWVISPNLWPELQTPGQAHSAFSLTGFTSFCCIFKASHDSPLQAPGRQQTGSYCGPPVLYQLCVSQTYLPKVTVNRDSEPRGWMAAVPRNPEPCARILVWLWAQRALGQCLTLGQRAPLSWADARIQIGSPQGGQGRVHRCEAA